MTTMMEIVPVRPESVNNSKTHVQLTSDGQVGVTQNKATSVLFVGLHHFQEFQNVAIRKKIELEPKFRKLV